MKKFSLTGRAEKYRRHFDPRKCPRRRVRQRSDWFGVLVLVISLSRGGLASEPAESLNPAMLRVVVPFYSAKAPCAMAVLRMDKLYQDHEERGFFKLGFLPVWVGEEATLEIKDVAATRDALERFHGWHHPPGGKRRLEWHHLILYNRSSDGARLQAGRARLETDGRCRLFAGVDYQADGKTWQAEEACLTMAGPHTGELILFRFAAPVRLHWPGTGSDNSREQAAKHKEDYEP